MLHRTSVTNSQQAVLTEAKTCSRETRVNNGRYGRQYARDECISSDEVGRVN